MVGSRSITTALASVEEEIWAATRFLAFGATVPAAGGRFRVEMHDRTCAHAHVLEYSQVPPALTSPLADGVARVASCTTLRQECAVDRSLSWLDPGALIAVPCAIPGGGVFWVATSSACPEPDAADLRRVAQWADGVAAASREEETLDAREARLTRLNTLATALHTLSTALDLREVFGQLSEITRQVLPHDTALVGVGIAGDMHRIRLHALSVPKAWQLPEVIDNPYPIPLTDGWDFAVHYDLSAHPVERDRPVTHHGLRSALRLPIWLDGRVQGALDFSAFALHHFGDLDIEIGRRVADYVSLALSHQQLADDAREAAAVRARADNLEMLDGLLKTLAGVLDVREVWDRVSEISHKVMTHDAMTISIPTDDGQRWTIHVTTGALAHLQTPLVIAAPTPRLLDSHWDFELVADMSAHRKYDGTPSVNAGLHALLSIPVWVGARLGATVNFFSRTAGRFTTDDVLVGRRIADHVALALSHQRLAEEQHRGVELRARAAKLELLDQLLATLTDSAELADVFDRISGIAKRVLAHDMLALPILLPDGVHARVYARSGVKRGATPEVIPIPAAFVGNNDWEFDLEDDVQAHPEQRNHQPAKLGYRSVLRVPIRLEGKFAAALVFFSLEPALYTHADVGVARRIADRVALCLARERGAEVLKRADEASARALKLESRVRALTEELDARTGYRRVVGESASWRQVLTQAMQVAATDTTVLLLGESGTGKEVIARFLHRASPRADGPFVALNCAALPEQLLEAELFGYERGAFTGATQSKPGQLEQAGGGSLFLDEVGEMSATAQAKFLRVLQEREFQRLGGTRVLRTDARVVAATNRDLQRSMEQGAFREDLFYRLNVFAIRLPPLRERRDDVLPLSDAFLAEIGRGLGRPPAGVSRDARAMLMDYHWPGNVRELRNILERAAILCEGGLITHEHLSLDTAPVKRAALSAPRPASLSPPTSQPPPATGDLKAMERTLIERALAQARFNKSKAAKELGLTRAQLYVRMKRYGLE